MDLNKHFAEILLQRDNPENTASNHKTRTDSSSCPLYGTDIASLDFHRYGAIKDAIRGKRFENDDELVKKRSGSEHEIETG
jgi:hypothetical protein